MSDKTINRVTARKDAETAFPAKGDGTLWPTERGAMLYEQLMVAANKEGREVSTKEAMVVILTVLDEFMAANGLEGILPPKA